MSIVWICAAAQLYDAGSHQFDPDSVQKTFYGISSIFSYPAIVLIPLRCSSIVPTPLGLEREFRVRNYF